jgi:NAD(P)-dependent dehydrogenase (short-subunit alcohol dehydrogenase family)
MLELWTDQFRMTMMSNDVIGVSVAKRFAREGYHACVARRSDKTSVTVAITPKAALPLNIRIRGYCNCHGNWCLTDGVSPQGFTPEVYAHFV